MVKTFTDQGGKVDDEDDIWAPLATTDYGASLPAIPANTDAVIAVVAGVARIRLFEAWYNFGSDKKFKLHGGYWLHEECNSSDRCACRWPDFKHRSLRRRN
jgi:hypothetical protein